MAPELVLAALLLQPVTVPVCSSPEQASIICEEAIRLYDEATALERAFDKCTVEKRGLQQKLVLAKEVKEPSIEIRKEVPDWVWVTAGVLVVVSFAGGFLAASAAN